MGKFKIKNNKKSSKLDKFDSKVNSLIDALIPAIIILIPVIFLLYVLNIHGCVLSKSVILFRLNNFYQYLMYILAGIYFYKVINKKIAITKSDVLLFGFMFLTVLSTILAHNTEIALYGYPNRYEGMYTLLFYCFLYLDCKLLSKDTDIKFLIRMMLVVSCVHFVLVLLQLTGLYQLVIYMYKTGDAIGLTENCNFLGSLMCLFSIISVGGYLLYNKRENGNYFFVMFIVSYITLLLANSSGPFLGFIITFFLIIVVLLMKKILNLKKIFISIIIIVCLYPMCLYNRDEITPELKSNYKTIINFVFRNDKAIDNENNNSKINGIDPSIRDLGHGRIRIWSNVWDLIKEKPLLGYGPDNLGLVYKKSVDDSKIADKAHNIYLHIFVSSGAFAVLSYILWVGYTICLGLKSNDVTILILCFGIIAYCIQGIFNINVLEVTPYFYLTIGFMMYLINEKKISLNK